MVFRYRVSSCSYSAIIEEGNMAKKRGKTQADTDWENRALCSDGNCIGIIGADGVCKECGKPLDSNSKPAPSDDDREAEADTMDHTPESSAEGDEIAEPQGEADEPIETETDHDWEQRTLCSDESCIGVIGTDGRCKECGQPYEQT